MATKVNPVTGALDYYEQALPPFRNKVINGAMQISQRGNVTGITTTTYGGPDRFQNILGSAGTWSLSKSTDVPSGSGFSNSFKIDCTTANSSLSSGSSYQFGQKIEGQNVQDLAYGTSSAKSVTLSFWVKSNVTGTYILEFVKETDSRQINRSYTIDSANTWEHKIVTIPGDTSSSLTNDNSNELAIYWWFVAGSAFTSGTLNTSGWASSINANRVVGQVNLASSTSNELYITGVQLEVGSSATPFEHRPIGTELSLCQRYFEKVQYSIGAIGGSVSARRTRFPFRFAVDKRATPAVTISSSAVIRCNTPTATEVYTTSVTLGATNTHTNGDDYSAQGSFTASSEL